MNYNRTSELENLIEDNKNSFILSPDVLVKMINLYKNYRELDGFQRGDSQWLKFCRKYLSFLLERLYWSQFDDTHYIGIFLKFLFEVDAGLTAVVIPNTRECPSFKYLRAHNLFDFFARHAYLEKLLFCGRRLPCLLFNLHQAIDYEKPLLLEQMLRYGALLSFDYLSIDDEDNPCDSNPVAYTLEEICGLNPSLLKIENLVLNCKDKQRYKSLVKCGNLLLRDFSQWDPSLLGYIVFQRTGMSPKEVAEAFSANVLPGLKTHFTEPMTLKQSCRLCVRRALNSNWYLPNGIESLPIPKLLREYMD